jgi:RNA polymerase sigma-70 factor, ECF subfamily
LKLVRPHSVESPPVARDATPPSFDQLYDEQFPFVWRCLRGLGVPAEAMDDAAQDVFVAVHRQLPGFRAESQLRTWIYGITRHIAANHRRRDRRKAAPLGPLDGVDAPDQGPDPLERAQDVQAASFVERFLARLDTKKREVFLLAFVEQMTVPEVAATLSIPLNTAYTRLRRARADFQRALERRDHVGR